MSARIESVMRFSSVSITGTDHSNYVPSNACPSSLAPTDSCIISVTFTPTATGTRPADLTVVDNAEISKQNVPLTGKGSN